MRVREREEREGGEDNGMLSGWLDSRECVWVMCSALHKQTLLCGVWRLSDRALGAEAGRMGLGQGGGLLC